MNSVMTIYDKALLGVVAERFGTLSAVDAAERLIDMGLIDQNRCKAMIVREYVESEVAGGSTKVDAMYAAAEKFCCSYECVRKYIYYYRN